MAEKISVPGGSFLVQKTAPEEVFTPEDFTSEQLMYGKTARDFVEKDVVPLSERIEAKDNEVTVRMMAKAGELGLLMSDIPEAYDGLGLDKASTAIITENLSGQGSFSVTYGAHSGIGTLPIVYYGNEETKKKYLPGLGNGTAIGAYCLTENTSGSDALSGRTKAVLSADGKYYTLNGTKQFITNGAFAHSFIVFAKVDGEHFTGFVCDKTMEGLKIGPEEHKLGIRGSSTTTVILEDVKVPVENLLGEIGKGHKIAFNILNIGRFKLGIATIGATKLVLKEALHYALERKQFGQKIADFGLIREKLANIYARTWAGEAAGYRMVGLIDNLINQGDHSAEYMLKSIEEYSVECAIMKVVGSEILDYAVDENVQIHGGYGFCSEYPAELHYRDSRINRIFEGTNEINRLLIPGMLLKKAMKGELPFLQAATKLQAELMDIPSFDMDEEEKLLGSELKMVENLKKITLFVAGTAAQKYGFALEKQQMVLARAADLAIGAYVSESAVLRALKLANKVGADKAALQIASARIVTEEYMCQADQSAREALAAMADGDALVTMLAALRRLTRRTPANTLALREVIAAKMVSDERTPFQQ